jgi:hypothetical protein
VFHAAYDAAKAMGALDSKAFRNPVNELPDGCVQMYLRDPAGAILQKERADKSHRRTRNGTRKRTGKGTPGEPEAEPAREPGTELRKRISNEAQKRTGDGTRKATETKPARESEPRLARESEMRLTQHSGNRPRRMARESSYGEWTDGMVRETRVPLVGPE